MFEYSIERYEKFDILKDKCHKSLHGITISPSFINRLINNANMQLINDDRDAYRYYLLRRMHKIDEWYKPGLFDFYVTPIQPYTTKFIFVVNKKNGRLDNIISHGMFYDICTRIDSNSDIYAIHDHAIKRASERVPELYCWKPERIHDWLVKKIKNLRPCSIKPQYKVLALLNHHFESCKYYMDSNGRVYVVKDHMLMTLHCNEADRWIKN